MGISTDRGYAIIIRHRFAGVTVRSLRFNPVSVPPHLSTEIQGASIRSPLLPIPPGCSSVRKLGLQPWGMHGVVKRCSRLPWRPIVTRHPSPLISPTFYPHARWSGGRTTSSHTKPKTLVSYYAAKPVNCLLYVEFRPSILSLSPFDRSRNQRILLSYAARTRCYASTTQWWITRVWIFGKLVARYSHIVPICRGIISSRVRHSIQASSL